MTKFCWLIPLAMLGFYSGHTQNISFSGNDTPANWLASTSFFLDFSATIKNGAGVHLRWKVSYTGDGDYFLVERSIDGMQYETASAIKVTDTSSGYEVTDNSLGNGSFLYRIRYINKAGKSIYSRSVPVSFSADVDFRFYPNPVDRLLIIRTGHLIDVQVIDAVGTVRLNKQLPAGLQVVNLAALEKGIYVLKIADRESNRVISEQLVKN